MALNGFTESRALDEGRLPAARSGFLSTVAAKVAVAIGVGLVAGATAVVVTNAGDPPAVAGTPSSTVPALKVDVAEQAESFDSFTISGRYAWVSGLDDPALEQRVNEALAAPLDEWIDFLTYATSEGPPGTPPAVATVEATVRISGPKVVSVEYMQVAGHSDGHYFGAGGMADVVAVAVDLSTGEPLWPTDVFPDADTAKGAAAITARVLDAYPQRLCDNSVAPLKLTPESFTDLPSMSHNPLAAVVFTEDGAEFVIIESVYRYPGMCDHQRLLVRYESLTDLMSQEAVELLTG